jgi:hypothetical protein
MISIFFGTAEFYMVVRQEHRALYPVQTTLARKMEPAGERTAER